ncbi:MAG: LacI family DNA-binding transcriptional regulator [Ferruginibacter sp.]|nr:LacI family DNA-binding transcriptional regulator [Ferruginibacter sp.]
MDNKIVTIKEIATKLNISPSTVSRALHDHKSIGLRTKARVQELAKQLNYEPNQTAIFFQQRKTFTIGVILPELSEAFFSSAISGIEDCANKNKYTVLMGQSHDDTEREKQLVETMKNHRVDGLLVSIAKNTISYEHFEAIKKYDIPVVFFDRIPSMENIHYVACNMASGTTQAFNFLRKLGHKTIGMINGPMNLLASKERVEGYRNALTKARLKYDPSLIISCDLTTDGIHKVTEKLLSLKNKPTAIIAFNDYVLLDAVQAVKKLKLKINKDVSFVSYANLPISNYSAHPPLASVEQFSYQQGYKAMEIMLDLLSKNNLENDNTTFYKIILEPQLIIHTPAAV